MIKIDNRTTEQRQQDFLTAFGDTANISKAAKMARIGRQSVYDWLKKDERFKEAFDNCNPLALGVLEDEATRRAIEGVNEPVFYKGMKVGTVTKYSDTLLIVLLKARAPEKYRERFSQEITGKDGKKLEVDISLSDLTNIPTEELLSYLDQKNDKQ